MPYFSVYALDKPGVLARREALRPEHRERLRHHDYALTVHVGGPLADADGAMLGSLLIIEAEDRAEVERFVAADPYTLAGLYQSVEIRPFKWGLGLPQGAQ